MKKDMEKYVRDHSLALTKLCLSLTRRRSDAEDLFQSTWEKAIRNIRRYDSDKPFEKWLFTICVNTFRDKVKRYENQRILCFPSEEEQKRCIESIPCDDDDRDDYIVLHTAVRRLKSPLREVIVLYYFRDYSVAELADILQIPEGTVKSRLAAARAELRKELNDDG